MYFQYRDDVTPHSRDMMRPRFVKTSALANEEGAGKTEVRAAPRAVSCATSAQKQPHTSIQVSAEASGLPCAMVLRLITRSPC